MTEAVDGIDNDDYADGYKKSIDELKLDPRIVEMDELCHKVFMTEDGKRLMELMTDRFLIPSLANPNSPQYKHQVVFFEGVKEMVRMLRQSVMSHQQRIEAPENKG